MVCRDEVLVRSQGRQGHGLIHFLALRGGEPMWHSPCERIGSSACPNPCSACFRPICFVDHFAGCRGVHLARASFMYSDHFFVALDNNLSTLLFVFVSCLCVNRFSGLVAGSSVARCSSSGLTAATWFDLKILDKFVLTKPDLFLNLVEIRGKHPKAGWM